MIIDIFGPEENKIWVQYLRNTTQGVNDEIFPDLYSSIGGIFLKLGRKDEAFELYKKGYIIQQRKLGDDHFMTKQTKNILHQNFQQQYS